MLFEVDPLNLHYMTDIDNNGLTEKCQNWKYCGNKDVYILDALEVSWNISKINFKVNYPFNNLSLQWVC